MSREPCSATVSGSQAGERDLEVLYAPPGDPDCFTLATTVTHLVPLVPRPVVGRYGVTATGFLYI